MKDTHLFIIFGLIFLIVNFYILAMPIYSIVKHILVDAPLLIVFFLLYGLNRRYETPKSMSESINSAKEFYRRTMGSDSDEPPIEFIEGARYKEDVLATRKNAVHAMVFKNILDDSHTLIKDDAFLRTNPASVVFFNKAVDYMKKPYETKAEFEREIKYVSPKEKEKRRKVKIKKEMESETK